MLFEQVFHSGKFVVGFSIFVAVLLIVIIYPLIVTHPAAGDHQPGHLLSARDLCERL
jgi:hypothetical protein